MNLEMLPWTKMTKIVKIKVYTSSQKFAKENNTWIKLVNFENQSFNKAKSKQTA